MAKFFNGIIILIYKYINLMKKRNLIFPLVVSSLFMPSIEAIERTTDLNSLENENNIYEAVDNHLAVGSGGGGMTMEEKKKRKERQKS